jgi:Uma2 family endonuclease
MTTQPNIRMIYTDGLAVEINDETAHLPDASAQRGVEQDLDSLTLQSPIIVVEVVSPSSERDDARAKLVGYFSVPSIRRYLIISPWKSVGVHHGSDGEGAIRTLILSGDGHGDLSPPGLSVPVARLLGGT